MKRIAPRLVLVAICLALILVTARMPTPGRDAPPRARASPISLTRNGRFIASPTRCGKDTASPP
jgi:hypothetical protein